MKNPSRIEHARNPHAVDFDGRDLIESDTVGDLIGCTEDWKAYENGLAIICVKVDRFDNLKPGHFYLWNETDQND